MTETQSEAVGYPYAFSLNGRMLPIKPDLQAHLGQTRDKIESAFRKTLSSQELEVIEKIEAGLPSDAPPAMTAMDYLFLRHNLGTSLNVIGRDLGIAGNTLGRMFDRLGLPRISKTDATKISKRPPQIDIEAMVQLMSEQIRLHREDPSYELSTNAQLGDILGSHKSLIGKLAAEFFTPEDRKYREQSIKRQRFAISAKRNRETGKRRVSHINPLTGNTYAHDAGVINGKRSYELGTGVHALTREQREKYGRIGGIITAEAGMGVHALTHEQHMAAGHKGGSKSRDNQSGMFTLSPERKAAIGLAQAMRSMEEGTGIFGLSDEEKKKYAQMGGRTVRDMGKGVFGVDPETNVPYRLIGGRNAYLQGAGIHGLSIERRRAIGVAASEVPNSNKTYTETEYFDSVMEAATAVLLERYIPGFHIERGETYQISTGILKKIDFLINQVFVEFNPILLTYTEGSLGAFETENEFIEYQEELGRLSPMERKRYKNATREILKGRYFQRRREALDENPDYRKSELVVVTDPIELYDQVIQRFGAEIPTLQQFLKEFEVLRVVIKDQSEKIKNQKDSSTSPTVL